MTADDLTPGEIIALSTQRIAGEISVGRVKAHAKHGANSIEAVPASESGKWLAILVEEVGELAHELTYDARPRVDAHSGQLLDGNENRRRMLQGMRAEALDVATVAVALIAAIDTALAPEPAHGEPGHVPSYGCPDCGD